MPTTFDSSNYAHSLLIDNTPNYNLYWTVDSGTIRLAFSVEATGWVGFGIAEPSSGSMEGSDLVVYTGETAVSDMYVLHDNVPVHDISQDWTFVNAEVSSGVTYVEVTRPLVTKDLQDRDIQTTGLSRIVVAWGADGTYNLGYHGVNRQPFAVDFSGVSTSERSQLRNDLSLLNVTFLNQFVISAEHTAYEEVHFDLTELIPNLNTTEFHIVGFEDIISARTRSHVHHFVVYLETNETNPYYEQQVVYLWAAGQPPVLLPQECGFMLNNGKFTRLLLQTHYDNEAMTNIGLIDYSGINMYYTTNLRQHDCGVMQLGDPAILLSYMDPVLPAGYFLNTFGCPGYCIDHAVTVFSSAYHMHSTGYRMYTEHLRTDSEGKEIVTPINPVNFFDAKHQLSTFLNLDLLPGDSFRTTCIHYNEHGGTRWGFASSEEMCIHFLFYFPYTSDYNYCGFSLCGNRDVSKELSADAPELCVNFGNTQCCEDPFVQPESPGTCPNDLSVASTIVFSTVTVMTIFFVSFT